MQSIRRMCSVVAQLGRFSTLAKRMHNIYQAVQTLVGAVHITMQL